MAQELVPKFKNILYLHGFRNNEQVMQFQTRKLRKLLPDCNHHFVNAPFVSKKELDDAVITRHFKAPYYEHCHFDDHFPAHPEPHEDARYHGIDESIDYWRRIAKEKDIDGIVGFSQGSYIAAILSNDFPLKFLVSVSGHPCLDEKYPIDPEVPAFHLVGEQDEWCERGVQFSEMYKNTTLVKHKHGHCFPNETAIYRQVVSWMNTL